MNTKTKESFPPILAYIPVGFLSIKDIIEGTRLNPDRMRVLLHQFFLRRLVDSMNDETVQTDMYKEGWVSLSSVILHKVATENYKKYLNLLEEKGFIVARRNEDTGAMKYAQHGSFARYKIVDKFLRSPSSLKHYRKELVTDRCTLKAVRKVHDTFHAFRADLRHLEPEEIHQSLIAMTNNIRFNVEKAELFIEGITTGNVIFPPTRSGHNRNHADMLLFLDAWNSGYYRKYQIDRYGERLHSGISKLWKPLRNFIYFKDEPDAELITLDVANSQPFFSSIAIDSNIIEQLAPEFTPVIPYLQGCSNTEDFKFFAELCCNGKIYEHFQQLTNSTREEAKGQVFYLMFSPNRRNSIREGFYKNAKRLFKQAFPNVDRCFRNIKSLSEQELLFIKNVYVNYYGGFEGRRSYHKNLSCLMQRLESRIVLKHIAPKLIKAGITPFTTIHDSFLLKKEHEIQVRVIIEKEFTKLGVKPPTIKTENLGVKSQKIATI
ncbi:MAG TPA: hypothetical protein VK783_11075 [Bacteroidia bacterium]|jgi:hypothetical protein|nr:hypothetical protein [Bacteroidia bacterium]